MTRRSIFSMLAAVPFAYSQKRVALVNGNSAYQHTPAQDGPVTLRLSALWKGHYQVTFMLEAIDVAGTTDGAAQFQR